MRRSAFFISDVHLRQMASPQGEALLSLLRTAQAEASLFVVLGDLFDLWVGEGLFFRNRYSRLIDEFKKLRETCRIIYFEGNHDIHLKKFWRDKMGFEVHATSLKFEFNGLTIWAEHGDEINKDDKGYLFLRWLLRTRSLERLSHLLPSRLIALIGDRASKASRAYTDRMTDESVELFRKYAQALRQKETFDLLITGHTHNPDDFCFDSPQGRGRLINLGSWFDGPHYLRVVDRNQIEQIKI